MNILLEFDCNLIELDQLAKRLAQNVYIGDIYLLEGDLGVGKTTFARYFINSLYEINKLRKPDIINSPSFPIKINYPLIKYEIFHYDFYRLKDERELNEIEFFEDSKKNISIIEWPDIVLNSLILKNYYLIEFKFIDFNNRKLKIQHSQKSKFF